MFKYERRIYFEWLIAMRIAYPRLGEEDRTSVVTIDDVVAWAEHELASTSVGGPNPPAEA
jgi:hypothetical protein